MQFKIIFVELCLKSLEIGEKFNGKLILPYGLEELKFCKQSYYTDKIVLPDTIRILPIEYIKKLVSIPKSLELIEFSKHNKNIPRQLEESKYSGKIVYLR